MPDKPAVVVILDASVQREVFSQSLVDEGFDVSVAETATGALTIIQVNRPGFTGEFVVQ